MDMGTTTKNVLGIEDARRPNALSQMELAGTKLQPPVVRVSPTTCPVDFQTTLISGVF